MLGYVVRRLLWTPPLLLFVMLVTFALMRGIGGSPFRLESGGLPEPLVIQVTAMAQLVQVPLTRVASYSMWMAALVLTPSS